MGYTNEINRTNFIRYTAQPHVGDHYLWGAKGETPNQGGTIGFVPKFLNAAAPAQSVFCTARSTRNGAVCAGAPQLVKKDPSRNFERDGYKNPISPGDRKLLDFINQNINSSEINWDTRPTPRTARMSHDGVHWDSTFLWGDGCDGTQHFDCIGFICYCLNKIDSRFPLSLDISHFFYSPEAKSRRLFNKAGLNAMIVDKGTRLWAADIIIYGTTLTDPEQEKQFFKDRAKREKDLADKATTQAERTRYEAEYRIDNDDASAMDSHQGTDSFLPAYGIGQSLHHIAFATGTGNQTIEALDSLNGVTSRGDYNKGTGNVARIVRLDDYYFRGAKDHLYP